MATSTHGSHPTDEPWLSPGSRPSAPVTSTSLSVSGGDERRLTRGNHNTQGLAWAPDGRSLAFSAVRLGGGSPFALWRVPASGGDPVRLEFGEHGMRPTTSGRSGRLAYVREELRWDIWRVGGPTAPEEDRVPRPLISSTAIDYFPRYSPDGREIAFVSSRTGAQEVWTCDADGSRPRQLTFQGSPLAAGPFWSPDGRQIAYDSPREGSEDVWVVSRIRRPSAATDDGSVAGAFGGLVARRTMDLPHLEPEWKRRGVEGAGRGGRRRASHQRGRRMAPRVGRRAIPLLHAAGRSGRYTADLAPTAGGWPGGADPGPGGLPDMGPSRGGNPLPGCRPGREASKRTPAEGHDARVRRLRHRRA